MAPVKRRPAARSQHRMKSRPRKSNIPQLVYKFLRGAQDNREGYNFLPTCNNCGLPKHEWDPTGLGNSQGINWKSMGSKRGKGGNRGTKSRVEKRRRVASQQATSGVHKSHGNDDLREIKTFIQKALDFGVKSGYLVAKDSSHRVLRVSSELMDEAHTDDKDPGNEKTVSQERERTPHRTSNKTEEYRETDAGRRRKRRRRGRGRSRSGSRRRRRRSRRHTRRSRSQHPEEITKNVEEFELDSTENRKGTGDVDTSLGDTRLNHSDNERTTPKRDDEETETSTAEDETDDDEEKKGDDTSK